MQAAYSSLGSRQVHLALAHMIRMLPVSVVHLPT